MTNKTTEKITDIKCNNRDSRYAAIKFPAHDDIESTLLEIANNENCHDIPHVTRMEIRDGVLLVKGGGYYTDWKSRPLLQRELEIQAQHTKPQNPGSNIKYFDVIPLPNKVYNYKH